MQLHSSLQDLRQGNESVTQFMQKAKALFDELAANGRPVSLEDFNLYVFRGLQGEFKDLVTSLIPKPNLYRMWIFTVISSRMNFFTNLRLPYMLLCCPHPTP
jgi:hypothetical protein